MATQSPPKRRLRRFLLARHGETNFNKEHRVQGTSDASVLTSDGQCQAAALGVYIAHRQDGEAKDDGDASAAAAAAAPSIARTWCSPLGRCRQTYDAVSNACSSNKDNPLPTPTIHSDLREIELCEWQGRLRREIMVADTENWHVFKTDPKMLRLKNGTFPPVVDCWERGAKNWEAIRSDAAENNDANNNSSEEGGATFIMAHGAIGQCMLLHAIGLPIQNYGKSGIRYMFDNCECVEMEWADGEEHCVRWRWAHISRALKEGGQKKSMWVESAASRRMDGGGALSCGR